MLQPMELAGPELLEILRNEFKSIVNMNVTEQFIHIMSYEGPLLPRIAKFMQEILSVKRNIYLCDTWKNIILYICWYVLYHGELPMDAHLWTNTVLGIELVTSW